MILKNENTQTCVKFDILGDKTKIHQDGNIFVLHVDNIEAEKIISELKSAGCVEV